MIQSDRILMEDLGALLNQATGTDEVEASPRYQRNLCLALDRALPKLGEHLPAAILLILQAYTEVLDEGYIKEGLKDEHPDDYL
jgi:hypothetical protein